MTLFPQNNALQSILQGRYAQLFPGSRQLKVKFKKHVLFHNSNYQLSQAHLLIMDHPVSLITKTFSSDLITWIFFFTEPRQGWNILHCAAKTGSPISDSKA